MSKTFCFSFSSGRLSAPCLVTEGLEADFCSDQEAQNGCTRAERGLLERRAQVLPTRADSLTEEHGTRFPVMRSHSSTSSLGAADHLVSSYQSLSGPGWLRRKALAACRGEVPRNWWEQNRSGLCSPRAGLLQLFIRPQKDPDGFHRDHCPPSDSCH